MRRLNAENFLRDPAEVGNFARRKNVRKNDVSLALKMLLKIHAFEKLALGSVAVNGLL